ncbi:hypothetical protein [Oleiphilus messinensis]|nr:hypothetical protein [Oleiphilus messinensis]
MKLAMCTLVCSYNGYASALEAPYRFLEPGETVTLQANAVVLGASGSETVIVKLSPEVVLDGNIERVELPEELSNYRFSISGTVIEISEGNKSIVTFLGLNQSPTLVFSDGNTRLSLNALDDATLGGVSIPGTPSVLDVVLNQDDNAADTSPAFNFLPDEGIRQTCAAVPRIGYDTDSETYYLYHSSELTSGGSTIFSSSANGFDFSAPQSAGTLIKDTTANMPPLWGDKTAFPQIVRLPTPTESETCGAINYRIFSASGNLGQGFGSTLTSSCSEEGRWFLAEGNTLATSEDGGNMGVSTAITMNNLIHVFTMDGKSPNTENEYRHRVWHYQSTDGTGNTMELMSDDPLNNGPTIEAKDRQNDPMAFQYGDGHFIILTMKQHNGPISPQNVVTGEIYGWEIRDTDPESVAPLPPKDGDENQPLLTVEDFVAAGHDVYSINDPSMIQITEQSYRMYVGALVNITRYPEYTGLSECAVQFGEDITQYAWVILSATATLDKSTTNQSLRK